MNPMMQVQATLVDQNVGRGASKKPDVASGRRRVCMNGPVSDRTER